MPADSEPWLYGQGSYSSGSDRNDTPGFYANRKRILNAFIDRKDENYFAKLVLNETISENDYNIAVSSYVEQENTQEIVNITELNQRISEIVARQDILRTSIDEIVADLEMETV